MPKGQGAPAGRPQPAQEEINNSGGDDNFNWEGGEDSSDPWFLGSYRLDFETPVSNRFGIFEEEDFPEAAKPSVAGCTTKPSDAGGSAPGIAKPSDAGYTTKPSVAGGATKPSVAGGAPPSIAKPSDAGYLGDPDQARLSNDRLRALTPSSTPPKRRKRKFTGRKLPGHEIYNLGVDGEEDVMRVCSFCLASIIKQMTLIIGAVPDIGRLSVRQSPTAHLPSNPSETAKQLQTIH